MNCRIVGAICQHNFAQAQTVWSVFNEKKAHYFEKSQKIVTLTNYFIHSCPCFHLTLNKIPLNKTKNASDVWPRRRPRLTFCDANLRAFSDSTILGVFWRLYLKVFTPFPLVIRKLFSSYVNSFHDLESKRVWKPIQVSISIPQNKARDGGNELSVQAVQKSGSENIETLIHVYSEHDRSYFTRYENLVYQQSW